MLFHVVHEETGETIAAQGFWAIDEYGELVDVIDGWGCEGGGGSNPAPDHALAVFGAPRVKPPVVVEPVKLPKAFKCKVCTKAFTTLDGLLMHSQAMHKD